MVALQDIVLYVLDIYNRLRCWISWTLNQTLQEWAIGRTTTINVNKYEGVGNLTCKGVGAGDVGLGIRNLVNQSGGEKNFNLLSQSVNFPCI